MQIPGLWIAVLAKNPEGLSARVRGNEIIAVDLFTIPPSGFDALGPGEELEIALVAGIAVPRDEALRALEQPGGTWRKRGRSNFSAIRKIQPDSFFGTVIVGERDAEDAIATEARGQAPDQALAIDRLLLRAGKPRRLARHVRQERVGAQRQADRGSGENQAAEPFTRDGEYEIGLALGRSEIELETGRGLAQVLERDQQPQHARAPAAQGAFEFGQHASQREKQRLHAFGLGRQFEPRFETRRRNMWLARIDDASDEAIEREGDLRTEAPCDSFRGQLERIAQPQDAEIMQAREGLLRPIEQEKRQVVEALAQIRKGKAAPHLQPARFRSREKPRRKRCRRDPHRGSKAEVVDAAPNGGDELRVPLEEPDGRFDLEHDALPIDAGHRSELPRPSSEPFERRALGLRIALDHAQVCRERTRRSHALPFANARAPRRLVGAR